MSMTETPPPVVRRRGLREYVAATVGGVFIALLELLGVAAYPWISFACFAVAAIAIAVVDARTQLLPNRYTGPFALAAAIQVAAVGIHRHDLGVVLGAVIAAVIVFVAYTAMGLAGWVGFGDAKFGAGLALFAGIFAGWLAVYILPVAVLLSAAQRGIRALQGRGRQPNPHGPALAAAFLLVTTAGILI